MRSRDLMRPESGSASLRSRVLALRSMPFLSTRHSNELTALAHHAVVRSFGDGDILVSRGEHVRSVFLLTRGVAVYRDDARVVERFEAPGSIGLIPMLASAAAPFDATAEGDVMALEVDADTLLAFFEDSFPVTEQAIRGLAMQLLDRRGRLPCDPHNPPPAVAGDRPAGPIDFVDRLLTLSAQPFFADVNLDALAEMARRQDEVTFAAGDRIWRLGDPSDTGLRIAYGVVRCSGDNGEVDIGHDYALGLFDSLARLPRAYSLQAVTDVVALTMSPEAVYGVIEEHFELGRGLLAALATQHLALTTGAASSWESA